MLSPSPDLPATASLHVSASYFCAAFIAVLAGAQTESPSPLPSAWSAYCSISKARAELALRSRFFFFRPTIPPCLFPPRRRCSSRGSLSCHDHIMPAARPSVRARGGPFGCVGRDPPPVLSRQVCPRKHCSYTARVCAQLQARPMVI